MHVKEPHMALATDRERCLWFIVIRRLIKNGNETMIVDWFPNEYLGFSECRPEGFSIIQPMEKKMSETESKLSSGRGRAGATDMFKKQNEVTGDTRAGKTDNFTSTSRVRDGQSLKGHGRHRIG